MVRDDQHADALASRPAGASRAVLQHLVVGGQVGVDDQVQVRDVDPARGDVGGHADARAAVPQRLERMSSFVLGQLARQRDRVESPFHQAGVEPSHRLPRAAEDEGRVRVEVPEDIDDRELDLVRRDADGPVVDVGVGLALGPHHQPKRVVLVGRGQGHDGPG